MTFSKKFVEAAHTTEQGTDTKIKVFSPVMTPKATPRLTPDATPDISNEICMTSPKSKHRRETSETLEGLSNVQTLD